MDIPDKLPLTDNETTQDESLTKTTVMDKQRKSRHTRQKNLQNLFPAKSPTGRVSEKYYQVVKSKDLIKKKKQTVYGPPEVMEIDEIGKIKSEKEESFKTYVAMGIDNLTYDNYQIENLIIDKNK